MRLARLGEFGAIRRIAGLCRPPGREVRTGIGDDAAAFVPGPGLVLVSADMMVEGVHFDLGCCSWRDVGFRALASNMSDIAAMGGRPRYYLVSAALRGDEDVRSIDGLYAGLEEAAGPYDVRLIGGDTTGTPGPRVVSVSITGEAAPRGPVRRSGARPGDDVYVTGTLGDSAGGLALLKQGGRAGCGEAADYLFNRHLRPSARVAAGYALGMAGLATSMIDISDGLSSDLGHILTESGVGARIYEELIPVSEELAGCFGRVRAKRLALHGGEDYELLFTAGRRARRKVAGLLASVGVCFRLVGEITGGREACLVTGKGSERELRPGGYEHFRR